MRQIESRCGFDMESMKVATNQFNLPANNKLQPMLSPNAG